MSVFANKFSVQLTGTVGRITFFDERNISYQPVACEVVMETSNIKELHQTLGNVLRQLGESQS